MSTAGNALLRRTKKPDDVCLGVPAIPRPPTVCLSYTVTSSAGAGGTISPASTQSVLPWAVDLYGYAHPGFITAWAARAVVMLAGDDLHDQSGIFELHGGLPVSAWVRLRMCRIREATPFVRGSKIFRYAQNKTIQGAFSCLARRHIDRS